MRNRKWRWHDLCKTKFYDISLFLQYIVSKTFLQIIISWPFETASWTVSVLKRDICKNNIFHSKICSNTSAKHSNSSVYVLHRIFLMLKIWLNNQQLYFFLHTMDKADRERTKHPRREREENTTQQIVLAGDAAIWWSKNDHEENWNVKVRDKMAQLYL